MITLELKRYEKELFKSYTKPFCIYDVIDISDNTDLGDEYFSITTSEKQQRLNLRTFEYVKDSNTGELYVKDGKWVAKSNKPIILPKEKYVRIERDGMIFMAYTLRQKVLLTIGLDSGKPYGKRYKRNGKIFYKPYRNYYSGNDKELDSLVDAGYMNVESSTTDDKSVKTYRFTRKGLDWVGEQLGITIR